MLGAVRRVRQPAGAQELQGCDHRAQRAVPHAEDITKAGDLAAVLRALHRRRTTARDRLADPLESADLTEAMSSAAAKHHIPCSRITALRGLLLDVTTAKSAVHATSQQRTVATNAYAEATQQGALPLKVPLLQSF